MTRLTRKFFGCLIAIAILFFGAIVFIVPRIYRAYLDRLCSQSIDEQVNLPKGWQVEQCTIGDWSGDFDAIVSVPSGQSAKQSINDFRRFNTTINSQVTIEGGNALIMDDERRLSIERDHRNTFTVRLVGPK